MTIEDLKEYYQELTLEEVKKNLSLDLVLMKITGKLDSRYVILLDVAQKSKILSKEEILNYKVKGYEAVTGALLSDKIN